MVFCRCWGSFDVESFSAADRSELPTDAQGQALIMLAIVFVVLPIVAVASGLLWVFYKSAELRYFAQYKGAPGSRADP